MMSAREYVDPNPQYWQDCRNTQRVKHKLIQEYLQGWFPILGSWAGRILYIDTHAGRGRHETGDIGSPLVALRTFINHTHRQRILGRCEVRFMFIEMDKSNLAALESELSAFGPLPSGVDVHRRAGDCEDILRDGLAYLREKGRRIAPSFMFVDPYGFRIPYPLLRDFMAFGRVELFVNVMWRHLNMAMMQASAQRGMADTMDFMFGSQDWRQGVTASAYDERADQVLELIRRSINARWMTPILMSGDGAVKYILAHFTNHEAGRDLMKEVMWKISPSWDGRFIARKQDDPDQGVLLSPEPDLAPLVRLVTEALGKRPLRWQELHDRTRETSWLKKHVNQVVRQLRKTGMIEWEGRFAAKHNPMLALKSG